MTEQEIKQYLIDNREKGIAFAFMPTDVQNWCRSHFSSGILEVFSDNKWLDTGKWYCTECRNDAVYSLVEVSKSAFTPHWEDLIIDSESHQFEFNDRYYFWWEWQKFLSDNYSQYNNFGGWRYENSEYWNTQPQVGLSGCLEHGRISSNYHIKNCVIPANPVRIRFWRF